MAEKEYTVVAPDGKEITLIGPVGASQDEIIAQAQKLYKPQATQPSFASPKENQTLYTEDTVYDQMSGLPLSSTPTQQNLGGGYETARNVATGVAAAPISLATGVARGSGSARIPQLVEGLLNYGKSDKTLSDLVTGNQPKPSGSTNALGEIERGMEQQGGEYLQKGLNITGQVAPLVMSGMQGSPLSTDISSKVMGLSEKIPALPSYAQKALGGSFLGGMSAAASPEATMGDVGLSSAIGGAIPVVGQAVKGINKGLGLNIGLKPSVSVPTAEDLANQSAQLFNVASKSGIQLDSNKFASAMDNIGRSLRSEGYTPTAYPKVTAALDEMRNTAMPKDFTELKALRKMIQGAQRSADGEERRLGTILKADFDNYIANIPNDSVIGGSKQGLQAWKEARDLYAKQSKAEVFEDMLYRAELDKSKFTASGMENSLAQQLRNLAKNERQMRLFTKEEQEAIVDAAKGGNVQNMLKFVGRFAPTGPVTGIFTGGAIATNPVVGGAIAGTTAASRLAASQMRKTDVNKLADIMRAGQQFDMIPKANLTDQQKNLARMLMLQSINQGDQ
jgi:hypothetical protein